ncbi:MAG: hypothetical protein HZB55_02740 [Deltaproteobacteria bacterium]|nr:hypothetical protein [Deltaproteobacteria bacterium]
MTVRGRGFFSACLVWAVFAAPSAWGRVSVNVNIGIPFPPLVVPAEPSLVLIPGTPVYFAPEVDVDLFFTSGYWWTRRDGRWLRARGYEGPWLGVGPRYVPRPVLCVPRTYRFVYAREQRIPYKEWKKVRKGRGYAEEERGRRGHRGHGGGWQRDDD